MRSALFAAALFVAAPAHADLLATAKHYVGMHERSNNAALRKLTGVNPARTPWCGAFVSAVVRKAGLKVPAGSNRAIAWRKAGRAVPLSSARRGDIVVLRSHVTVFSGRKGARVCGIGGNQSNRVQESCYSAGRIIAVRRLK